MVLPLGEQTKTAVYEMAAELGMEGVHGPESQDVCFLAGRSVAEFFHEQGVAEEPGTIVTTDGRALGVHRGLWHYTVGQRRGLGLPDATPWYVQRLDATRNRLIVCKKEGLLTRRVLVSDVRWSGSPVTTWRGRVQIRGRQNPSPAQVEKRSGAAWLITFSEPQRAVTPGQFAAFYEDGLVRGSGIITDQDSIRAEND